VQRLSVENHLADRQSWKAQCWVDTAMTLSFGQETSGWQTFCQTDIWATDIWATDIWATDIWATDIC